MTSTTFHQIPRARLSPTSSAQRRTARAAGVIIGLAAMLVAGCSSVPDRGKVWLSYNSFDKGCDSMADCSILTNEAEASYYYQTIGAEDANGNPNFNFEQWKQLFGYDESTAVRAVFGNRLDLQFGRDMHCWEPAGTDRVACFVTNYGASPIHSDGTETGWPATINGINGAGDGDIHESLATVAMVADPNGIGVNREGIVYYAFGPTDSDGQQPLIRSVTLDGEGPKTVPTMCMTCHRGENRGAWLHQHNFLPFDVQSYIFSPGKFDEFGNVTERSPFTRDNQQEAFRQLNALVLKTRPSPAIQNLINGWYAGNVNTPGATVPDDTYIPPGWSGDKDSRNLYRHVFRNYCRTCHVAQLGTMAFEKIGDLDAELLARTVCGSRSMPNAEVPYGSLVYGGEFIFPRNRFGSGFWVDEVAKSDLRAFLRAHGESGSGCE
jgi:hypothetical protein